MAAVVPLVIALAGLPAGASSAGVPAPGGSTAEEGGAAQPAEPGGSGAAAATSPAPDGADAAPVEEPDSTVAAEPAAPAEPTGPTEPAAPAEDVESAPDAERVPAPPTSAPTAESGGEVEAPTSATDADPAGEAVAPEGGWFGTISLAAHGGSRLGTADAFALLAGSTITNDGVTTVSGDVGLDPGTAVTGFDSCAGGAANCVVLTGDLEVDNAVALQAKSDLSTAYDGLVGLESTCTSVPVDLSDAVLVPGVYCSATLGLTGTLTLDGIGEFIFLTGAGGSSLVAETGSQVLLINGADACDVYWQVASSADIKAGSAFAGNILARTAISFGAAATLQGSALAQDAAVTLINNTITDSVCAAGGDTDLPADGGGSTPGGDDGALPGGDNGTPVVDEGAGGTGGTPVRGPSGTSGVTTTGLTTSRVAGPGGAVGLQERERRASALPTTGAPVQLALWLGLLATSAGVVLVLVAGRRRPAFVTTASARHAGW